MPINFSFLGNVSEFDGNLKMRLVIKKIIVRNSTIVKNFSYLSSIQVLNLILPLATYPYLIRVLGIETYGLVVFAQAVLSYMVIFVKFGFNISATKDISINAENKSKISEIASSVFLLKSVGFVLMLLLLLLLTLIIPLFRDNRVLFLLTLHICLYEAMFPLWYFQGIEKMKYIALLNFVSRSIALILIFSFIRSKSDYLYVPLVNGIGTITASFLSMWIIFRNHKIRFYIPPFVVIRKYFKESIPFFVSSLSTQLYTNANKLLIGIFLNMKDLALYDLAEKVTTLFKIPISLIGQTIYPRNVKEKNVNFIKKISYYTNILTVFIYVIIFLFAKRIVLLLGGTEMTNAIGVMRVLTFSVVPITIGHFFCTQTLIPFGYIKQYMTILTLASLLYLLLIFIAYSFDFIQIYQIAFITIMVQTYIALHSYILVKLKLKIW